MIEYANKNVREDYYMNYPLVGDIASKKIIYLSHEAILNDAISLITEHGIRNIVVHDADVDEYAYIGIDEVVHAITMKLDVGTPIVKIGLHPLISIPEDYNIFEASYFFIENESLVGVVNDEGKLSGVVSFIDVLSASMSLNKNMLDSPVRSIVYKNSAVMTSDGVYLDSLLESLDSMPTDCVVVHEDNIPKGVITKRDITKRIAKNESLNIPVEVCMHSPLFTVDGEISVRDALEIVQEHKHKRIFVVDDKKRLLGIVTQKELVSIIYHKVSHKAVVSVDKLNAILEQRVSLKAEEVQELKERYEYALSASSHGIWDWDLLSDELIVSKQLQKILNFTKTVLNMRKDYCSLIYEEDKENVRRAREESIELGLELFDCEYRIFNSQEYIWVKVRSKIIYNNSYAVKIVSTLTDITEYKQMQEKIKKQKERLFYQANYDSLTKLSNKMMFLEKLEERIKINENSKDLFALLLIDLDHFKEINDSFGHLFGDRLLLIITQRLKNILPEGYLLARYGGDEFIVMTQTLESELALSHFALDIIEAIKKPLQIDARTLFMSCSIGISLFPKDANSSENILKYVDSAMYKAKENGRNTYSFYTHQMTDTALQRVEMETDLHQAIDKDELEVYYQPQYDIFENSLIGLEALVRWNHPKRGLVSPDDFIPLAEESGLIIELDQIVMKKAMKQVKEWYDNGYKPGKLALNLAMKQLHQDNIVDIVLDAMREYGFKPEWLELEITESQIMKDPQTSIEKLEKLSYLGIEIAIDDFGTGYSSLAYLKKLPVDKLKIDKSFINDVLIDEDDAAIAKTVIALAKSLNLKVIAEGVEEAGHVDFLKRHDCAYAQGYFYAKPVPADQFVSFLTVDK